MNQTDIFQRAFERKKKNTGEIINANFPGIKLYPFYHEFIQLPILDLGCGDGDTARYLRTLYADDEANGCDAVILDNDMLKLDITDILPPRLYADYHTVLCCDVIEHIPDDRLPGLFKNFQRFDRQIISISNNPSIIEGVDLHINKKSFAEWGAILSEYINIKAAIKITNTQILFLAVKK